MGVECGGDGLPPGNKSLKAGIDWTTGILNPCSFKIATDASVRDLRSGVTIMYLLPVLSIRWATAEAEFLGEIAKATPSARMIPSWVVAYVIVSRNQHIVCQHGRTEEHGGMFILFTRIGQHRDDRLRISGL